MISMETSLAKHRYLHSKTNSPSDPFPPLWKSFWLRLFFKTLVSKTTQNFQCLAWIESVSAWRGLRLGRHVVITVGLTYCFTMRRKNALLSRFIDPPMRLPGGPWLQMHSWTYLCKVDWLNFGIGMLIICSIRQLQRYSSCVHHSEIFDWKIFVVKIIFESFTFCLSACPLPYGCSPFFLLWTNT